MNDLFRRGLTLVACAGCLWTTAVFAQPEREALNHYAGTWDSQFTIRPLSDHDEPKSFGGVVEAGWIVGERFLEQTGTYQMGDGSQPLVIKTIMSWDNAQQCYRYDYYISSGEIRRSTGRWDTDKKTMTSRFDDDADGRVTTIVADFSRPGVENWSIETRNREGQTVLRVEGANTRRNSR